MEIKCDCTVSLAIVFVPNASARQNVVVVATENVGINVLYSLIHHECLLAGVNT